MKTRTLIAVVILLAGLTVSLGGCAIIGFVGGFFEKVPAQYKLPDKPTLVLVDDPNGRFGDGALAMYIANEVGNALATNKAVTDLPDHAKLKGLRLPGISTVLDGKGKPYAEVFEPGNRRVWAPLSDIPAYVQKAFLGR